MTEPVDVDAMLAEDAQFTEVKFHDRIWKFAGLDDIPLSLYAASPDTFTEELTLVADTLTAAVVDEQRADFAALTITVREAMALFTALTKQQQGVEPGESSASPQSSETEG